MTAELPVEDAGAEALVELIEAGWEDEPTPAEHDLALIIAANILAAGWRSPQYVEAATRDAGEGIALAIEADPAAGSEFSNPYAKGMRRAAAIARAAAGRGGSDGNPR